MGDSNKSTDEQAPSATDASLHLGERAGWAGPVAYALAALVFVLAIAFEAHAASARPELQEMDLQHLGATAFSAPEYVAFVHWRGSVVLLLGAAVAAGLLALTAIYRAARETPRHMAAIALLGAFAVRLAYLITKDASPTSFLEQLGVLIAGLNTHELVPQASELPMLPKRCVEGVAAVIGAGAAAVVILPATLRATDLAQRIRVLRLLLYASAVMFVLDILMTRAAYAWLVSFFATEDEAARGALQDLVAAGTFSAGAFYSILLAAIYVPAAAILGFLGRRMAEGAAPDGGRESWLEQHGLAVSWRGQVARIATLLTPLVSSGMAQVLTEFG